MKNATTSNSFDEEDTRGRPGYYDFHAAPEPLTHDKRSLSFPSTISSSTTTSSTSTTAKRVASWLKPSVKPAQPKVNVHTTCGRHTDQLLFGGPSLTDMARAVFKKKN